MSPTERKMLRYFLYGLYGVAIVGAAVGVGQPWGWFVIIAGAAIPGIAFVRYELDERAIARDRAAGFLPPVGEQPGGGEAPSGEAPAPPPPPPPPPY